MANIIPSGYVQKGYQQLTGISSAVAVTVPAGASMAICMAETQAVRWRDDGTSPTATVGMPLSVNDVLVYDAAGLGVLKFIEQTATAKVNIAYYGPN